MNSETKWTPGPWECGRAHNYEGFYVAPAWKLPTLAAVHVFNFPEQTVANAYLIAAAPEMYEALEAIVAPIEHLKLDREEFYRDWFKQAKAALAKARGCAAEGGAK